MRQSSDSNKVLFTGHNSLLHPVISRVSVKAKAFVLHNEHYPAPKIGLSTVREVKYLTFGVPAVFKKIGSEKTVPSYVKGFRDILNNQKPNKIVSLDFHKLVFWQVLAYKKENSECQIYLYSETKAWPKNWLARMGMYVFWWYLKLHLQYVEKILVYTKQGEEFFSKRIKKVPTELCPVPVDVDFWHPDKEKKFMQNGVLRMLMNARFVDYKNHRDLLEAVKVLKSKNINIELSFIGRGGHMEGEMRQYVKDLQLEESVNFLEPVPQEKLREVYASHDLLVLPSYNEAIGMVVPEAMACGIPTLTSDTAGANVYVKEGETGLIFKTGDVSDLREKIRAMCDRSILLKYGQEARRHIASQHNVEKAGERFADIIGV
jgi:glycosyltransferase involved in cell wall biosynthesis